ncbi:MAG: CxxC-x17-CxxC domain-containing protein [Candidatus Omnitrophota bacterium]
MRKLIKHKNVSESTDLASLVNKIYEQLVSLEKKVDTLINRSSVSTHNSGDRFQRANSHFRRSDRFQGARYEERPREINFTQAVCAECGKECEVPFRPTGDRPVYCSDCFSVRNDSGSSRGKFNNNKRKGSFFRRRKEHSRS